MTIAKSAVEAFLAQPREDYSWLKTVPRREILDALWSLPHPPGFKTVPWLHQMVCVYIGICQPRFLFLLDMGLGKTKILLDLIQYRKDRGELKGALVCVPRATNVSSWVEEVQTHSSLSMTPVVGSIADKWELLHSGTDLCVIDYHGLTLALTDKVKGKSKEVFDEETEDMKKVDVNKLAPSDKKLRELSRLFNFAGADETHRVKNKSSLPFRILKNATKAWPFFYGLTGTPFGRNPEDVWSQFFLIDRGDTFGDTIGLFRGGFFKEVPGWAGHMESVFDETKAPLFHRWIQNRSIRYADTECLDLPRKIPRTIKRKFTDEQREHYLKALEGMVAAAGDFTEQGNCFVSMRRITSGYTVWKDEAGTQHVYRFNVNPKMDVLEQTLDEAGDKKVIVYYDYTETGRLIHDRLNSMKIRNEWVWSGNRNQSASIALFKNNLDVRVLVAQQECVGTGLNLQMAKYVFFFESPVSPINRKQAEKRTAERGGQTDRVYVIDPVIEKSIDLRVLSFIEEGNDLFASLVEGRARRSFQEDLFALRKDR